jgi:hypothetical protein
VDGQNNHKVWPKSTVMMKQYLEATKMFAVDVVRTTFIWSAEREAALRHLGDALAHWKRYAAIRDAHYVPALYNRVGHVNVTALTKTVAADLDIARHWKPGSLEDDGKRTRSKKDSANETADEDHALHLHRHFRLDALRAPRVFRTFVGGNRPALF